MSPDIEPITRESTAAIIARQLREAITSGVLEPGKQLGEAELAAQFQVSRGPLREAMQRLVSEGLLRSERHRGLFVIELEPADVYDIYAARAAIEYAAAVRIIRSRDTSAVAALEDALAELEQATTRDDPRAVSDADFRFHEVLVHESGSRRLVRTARTLFIETRMCLAALQHHYPDPTQRVAEHARITDAIRRGDEPAALSVIEAHMDDAVARLAPGTSLLSGSAPTIGEGGVDISG
ncbi:DNA-binding transcriptional regulator, GntR family [Haloechinothrix alba]|uniref:DNA-binding transcriptional regulator, GntR family n=1 Tax=Haloechinothrix alba TaxID=664784 RepID=A0A238YYP6_9PSEU|nr:GntR family transcriptional regulator [Haloechinothrix alba]SNR76356.1 DNA-binding transcriptional regulator, GntR family [Haloechinothrix alba]